MSLEQSGLTAQSRIQDALAEPQRSVIVALGEKSVRQVTLYSSRFLNGGGRILLAVDTEANAPPWWRFPGTRIQTSSKTTQYQYPDCVRVNDFASDSPLFKGVGEIILNQSTWLDPRRSSVEGWRTDARLPNFGIQPSEASGKPIVVSADGIGQADGRVVLCADPSLLTNGMLWHGDNAIFAINLSQFLAGDERDRVIVLVDGRSAGSYEDELRRLQAQSLPDIPIDQVPELGLEQALRVANTVAANTEDTDMFNALLSDRPRRLSDRSYRRGILLGLAGVLVLLAIYRLGGQIAKPTPVPSVPLRQPVPAAAGPWQGLSQDPSTRRGQAARLVAQQTLASITGSPHAETWREVANPRATGAKRSWSSGQLQSLGRLTEVATANPPKPMTLPELVEVDRLSQVLLQVVLKNS